MRDFKLTCKRGSQTVQFGFCWPLWLADVDGLTEAKYTVKTEKQSGIDGEEYQGAVATKRNIVIYADVKENHEVVRERLYSFFQPRTSGTLYVQDGAVERKIDYYVEFVRFEPAGRMRRATISLICPDPLFKATTDERVEMAAWQGLIEWPDDLLEIAAEPFELTRKTSNLIAVVPNGSNAARGLTITFTATGLVENPSLFEVNRRQGFKLNQEMHSGDAVVVTTGWHNKRVRLIRNGAESEINDAWVFGSTWLQAEPGDNVYRYDAQSGIDALEVAVVSTPEYWGV
ncbi:phage tail domain-containing protein [Allofournierella sp.]|uniref:phage tail domain-containing protein n=1 Tax=Allofournierella sp. TaxID=1940256 RepID=UPI003AF177B4